MNAALERWPEVAALLQHYPLALAMTDLLPGSHKAATSFIATKAAGELDLHPEVEAAIWLYVDDLERSHTVSQGIPGPVGAYWHGIMHRREGDFSNSKYWLRQAKGIDLSLPDYEPCRFVDQVETAGGLSPQELVELQRQEWMALFTLCMARADQSAHPKGAQV